MVNYRRKLRMGTDIRKSGKVEKATKFAERMKKVQEETRVVLRKVQKKIKQQVNRGKEWKIGDKVMLSTKDLIFKE